jgi:hypothetical protein
MAAAQASGPVISTTSARVCFIGQNPPNGTSNTAVAKYYVKIYGTNGPNQIYQPLSDLCSEARAAVERVHVPDVAVLSTKTGDLVYQRRPRTNCIPVRLHGGGAQEFILRTELSLHRRGYDARQLLSSLTHCFGNRVRRIHLINGMTSNTMIRSSQGANTTYRIMWSSPVWDFERIVRASFPGLPEPSDSEYQAIQAQPEVGEFGEEECRLFTPTTRKWASPTREAVYAELIRQYPDGRSLVNSAVKKERAKENPNEPCLRMSARYLLQQAATLAP